MTRTNDEQIQLLVKHLLSCLKADSRSSSEIAQLAAVSQPTVSRMRRSRGIRHRISKSFNKLRNFYNVLLTALGKADLEHNEVLREAIIDMGRDRSRWTSVAYSY